MSWDPQQYQQPQAGPGGFPPAAGARPANRQLFAAMTVGDYLRDAAAAILLLSSLALPWDFDLEKGATGHVEVVLITIVSLFSLALPYMARVGAFGPSFTVQAAGTVRFLANIPYAILFVVYLVVDAVAGDVYSAKGLGAAAALGLAGAILAAQPRDSEIADPNHPHGVHRAWLTVVIGLGALLVLVKLVSIVMFVVQLGEYHLDLTLTLSLIVGSLLTFVLAAWPALGTVLRDGAWRLVLVAIGAIAVGIYLVGAGSGISAPSVESMHQLSAGLILWPALGAAALAPSARWAMRADAGAGRSVWHDGAVRLLGLTIAVGALYTLGLILTLIGTTERGRYVFLVIFAALLVVAAVIARSALVNNAPGAQNLAYGVAGALLLLGLINVIAIASADYSTVFGSDLAISFGLPLSLGVLLAVPAVRAARARAALAPRPTGYPGQPLAQPLAQPTAQPAWPTTPPSTQSTPPPPPPPPPAAAPILPPPPPPPVSADVAAAMDPRTAPAILAELAARAPETHVFLARNPSTYPALVAWLGELGDPAVTAALRQRGV